MRTLAHSAAFVALALARPLPIVAQDTTRPLPIDALFDLNTLSGWGIGSLSPDGRRLVYAVREGHKLRGKSAPEGERYSSTGMSPDYMTGTNLFLVDTRTGELQRITDDIGRYEEPIWSPDGQHVAFYSDRDGAARLWVWDLTTRRMRRLTNERAHPAIFAHLQWSPDSKSVIALLQPLTEKSPRQVAKAPPSSPPMPHAAPQRDSTAAAGATVRVYRASVRRDTVAHTEAGIDTVTMDTVSIWGDVNADLATVDVVTGAVRRLVLNQPLFWYAPSPNGQWVATSRQSALFMAAGQAMYDYDVVPLSGGPIRTVSRRARAGYGTASWSPDSKSLAYVTIGTMAACDVFVADVDGGSVRNVTRAPHPHFTGEDATPYWSADGRSIFVALQGRVWRAQRDGDSLTAVTDTTFKRTVTSIVTDQAKAQAQSRDDGKSITVATIDLATKNVGFYRIDVSSGATTKLREEARRYGFARSSALASRDGSTIAYLAEDGQHPPDIWGGNADLTNPHQLTTLNPGISSASLGKTEVIDFTGPKGEKLQAVLLYPGNYQKGKRYPLIVRVYPGPYHFANNANGFGLDGATGIQNMQMYASRGYAVLLPEISQALGTPMRDVVEGVHVAVDKVIEMGVANPDQLGVTGQSYGGYSTIAVVTQSTRFKGALMSSGIGNMIDAALEFRPEAGTDAAFWTEGGQGLMGGTLWEQKQRYIDNSPVMFLDRVTTPVLIVAGESDDAVPVSMSDQIFVGLRRLGRDVEYRRYAGEGHVISSAENLTDYWRAAIRWFDRYVKGEGTPKAGGS